MVASRNNEGRIEALKSSVLDVPGELSEGCHYTAEREDEFPKDKLSSQQAWCRSLLCTLQKTSLGLFFYLCWRLSNSIA